jgi:Tfp pilus assembly protein PilF
VQTVYQTECNHDISYIGINMHNTEDALGPHKDSNTSSCVLALYTQRLHKQHSATHSIRKAICNQRHYNKQ